MRTLSLLALVFFSIGCGDDDGAPEDAGARDSGPAPVDAGREADGGRADAGPVPVDSGPSDVDGGPTLDSGPTIDAGPVGADAGCVTDPADACSWFDITAAESMVMVHGPIRIAFTAAAPSIVGGTYTFTVRDAEGTETEVMIEAMSVGTALRGDAGPVVPGSATEWTRLEIAVTDSCGTMPEPRAIYTFVSETGGRIEATCATP